MKAFFLATIIFTATYTHAYANSNLQYSVDLSTSKILQSRYASGSLSGVSSNSVTIVGSDGYYYPGTTSTLIIDNALSLANSFISSNSELLPLPVHTTASLGDAYTSVEWNSPEESYLNSLGGEGLISISYFEVKYSYDFSWVTNDTYNYDTPGGGDLPFIASTSQGGHVTNSIFVNSALPINFLGVENSLSNQLSWYIYSRDNVGGSGMLTIQNLTVDVTPTQATWSVSILPETEMYGMLLVGLSFIGYVLHRRRQQILL